METKHIQHVILYAKNFYVHTGNVVKDMQRFMQLDGHKYWTINTPEKVVAAMRKDYIKWINSIEDQHTHDFLIKNANDCKVAWADGPVAEIWCMLISYSGNYIPLRKEYVGYPIYDKYHLPQRNIHDIDYSSCRKDDYTKMIELAKKYIDTTLEEDYDIYMNRLMYSYPFESVASIFKANGEDGVTVSSLKDEMWEAYEKFMDTYLDDNGRLTCNYQCVITDHFVMSFFPKNGAVSIEVEAKLHHLTVQCEYTTEDETKYKLFDLAKNHNTAIDDIVNITRITESFCPDDVCDHHKTPDAIIRLFDDMSRDSNLKFGDGKVGTGSNWYELTTKDGVSVLDIYYSTIFSCAIKEGSLTHLRSGLIDDVRW